VKSACSIHTDAVVSERITPSQSDAAPPLDVRAARAVSSPRISSRPETLISPREPSQFPLVSSERASNLSIDPGSTVSVEPAGTTRSPVSSTVPASVVCPAGSVPDPPAVKPCVSAPVPVALVTATS